jgi:hypothetical protein
VLALLLQAIRGLLAEHLDPSSTVLFVSHCNERTRTFDGVDVCGERLAAEVRAVAARHPGLRRISILSHSMGGLISRYAAGRLFDPGSGTLAGLQPCHYVAIATPHLGCDTQHSHPAQVPLIGWLAAVPGVGDAVHGIVSVSGRRAPLAPPLRLLPLLAAAPPDVHTLVESLLSGRRWEAALLAPAPAAAFAWHGQPCFCVVRRAGAGGTGVAAGPGAGGPPVLPGRLRGGCFPPAAGRPG